MQFWYFGLCRPLPLYVAVISTLRELEEVIEFRNQRYREHGLDIGQGRSPEREDGLAESIQIVAYRQDDQKIVGSLRYRDTFAIRGETAFCAVTYPDHVRALGSMAMLERVCVVPGAEGEWAKLLLVRTAYHLAFTRNIDVLACYAKKQLQRTWTQLGLRIGVYEVELPNFLPGVRHRLLMRGVAALAAELIGKRRERFFLRGPHHPSVFYPAFFLRAASRLLGHEKPWSKSVEENLDLSRRAGGQRAA